MSTGFHTSSGRSPLAALEQTLTGQAARRQQLVRAAGAVLVAAIKEELSHPGTGRVYRRPRRDRNNKIRRTKTGRTVYGRPHQASAPGDPPAPDTGALRNSIHYTERNGRGIVGTNMAKAPALEFGTNRAGRHHTVKIAKRPFMRPALEKAKPLLRFVAVSTLRLDR